MPRGDRRDVADEPTLSRDAYSLLAQANLLRMRGRWDAAVEKCMAALRLAPENASAQSLLGDIYENQGRFDDAIQWYRMALDVNPDSPADKIKLGRLLDYRQDQRALISHASAPSSHSVPARPARDQKWGRTEQLLRWGAWLVVGLIVGIVVLASAAMSGHRASSRGEIKAPSVVVTAPNYINPSAPDSVPPATTVIDSADPAEQTLLQTMQQDAHLASQNITPVGVQMDPRQSAVTLTILCTPPQGSFVREALLRESAVAALAGSRAQGDRVPRWTIRCLMVPPGSPSASSPGLALVADTTPAALSALGYDPTTLSASQLSPAFHGIWWSPSVTQ